jgi:hypothetical protein
MPLVVFKFARTQKLAPMAAADIGFGEIASTDGIAEHFGLRGCFKATFHQQRTTATAKGYREPQSKELDVSSGTEQSSNAFSCRFIIYFDFFCLFYLFSPPAAV